MAAARHPCAPVALLPIYANKRGQEWAGPAHRGRARGALRPGAEATLSI